MIKQINTPDYWSGRWDTKKTGGGYGELNYYFLKYQLPNYERFTLLDVGCGRSAGIQYLLKLFPKGIYGGIDFSPIAIEKGWQKYKDGDLVHLMCSDCYKFNSIEKYDYVTIIETIEHMRWPYKLLEKYLSLTKIALFVSIPTRTPEQYDNLGRRDDPTHLYAYKHTDNPFNDYGAEFICDDRQRRKFVIRK